MAGPRRRKQHQRAGNRGAGTPAEGAGTTPAHRGAAAPVRQPAGSGPARDGGRGGCARPGGRIAGPASRARGFRGATMSNPHS